jgi:hypothetical protein
MPSTIAELEEWAGRFHYDIDTIAKPGSDNLWIVTLRHRSAARQFSGSYSQHHVNPITAYRNALGIAVGKAQAWEGRK